MKIMRVTKSTAITLLFLAFFGWPHPTFAAGGEGSELLQLDATKALLLKTPLSSVERISASARSHFRVVFRAKALAEGLSATVFGVRAPHALMVIDGWQAVVSSGATCSVLDNSVSGLPVFRKSTFGTAEDVLKWANDLNTPGTRLGSGDSSLVIGNFSCDAPVSEGDMATVQVRIYLRQGAYWHPADYTFSQVAIVTPDE